MKLPDVLKMAVERKDWYAVCKVYTAITGEPLEPPKSEAESLADLNIDMTDYEDPPAVIGSRPGHEEEYQEGVDAVTEEEEEEGSNAAHGIQLIHDIEYDEEDLEPGDEVGEEEIPEEFSDCVVRTKGDGTNDALKGSSEELGEKCKREPFRAPKKGRRKNKFKDDRRAFSRQDVTKHTHDEKGKPLGVQVAVGRSSDSEAPDTSRKVKVTCKLCNKKERVAASLATGHNNNPEFNRYKCNDCCAKGGKDGR